MLCVKQARQCLNVISSEVNISIRKSHLGMNILVMEAIFSFLLPMKGIQYLLSPLLCHFANIQSSAGFLLGFAVSHLVVVGIFFTLDAFCFVIRAKIIRERPGLKHFHHPLTSTISYLMKRSHLLVRRPNYFLMDDKLLKGKRKIRIKGWPFDVQVVPCIILSLQITLSGQLLHELDHPNLVTVTENCLTNHYPPEPFIHRPESGWGIFVFFHIWVSKTLDLDF